MISAPTSAPTSESSPPTSAAGNAFSPMITMPPVRPESSEISMPASEPVSVDRPQASA